MKERPRKKRARKTRSPRHEFRETRLGWLMRHRDPILYSLVTEISPMPSKNMLRSLAAYSGNGFLQSDEFWMELLRYSPGKLYTPSAEEELEMIRNSEHSPVSIDRLISHLL